MCGFTRDTPLNRAVQRSSFISPSKTRLATNSREAKITKAVNKMRRHVVFISEKKTLRDVLNTSFQARVVTSERGENRKLSTITTF